VLIHEAIGDQLTCVFVDHGLLRLAEAEKVVSLFRGHYNIPLVHVDAAEQFLSALKGVSDPEAKRKFIGSEFTLQRDEHAPFEISRTDSRSLAKLIESSKQSVAGADVPVSEIEKRLSCISCGREDCDVRITFDRKPRGWNTHP